MQKFYTSLQVVTRSYDFRKGLTLFIMILLIFLILASLYYPSYGWLHQLTLLVGGLFSLVIHYYFKERK